MEDCSRTDYKETKPECSVKFLSKYGGMVFHDMNGTEKPLMILPTEHMVYLSAQNGGWAVCVMAQNYDNID